MAGVWEGDKVRPGLYINFVSVAEMRIAMGQRGVVGVPVTAHWGPVGVPTEIASLADLKRIFHDQAQVDPDGETVSAPWTIQRALLGGASRVYAYRMAEGEAKASVTLEDTTQGEAVDIIELEAAYPGEYGNLLQLKVDEDPADTDDHRLTLYEGARALFTASVSKTGEDPQRYVDAINNAAANRFVVASKLANGEGALKTGQFALEDGDSGEDDVANTHYTDALDAFEGTPINWLALDGISDASLHTSVRTWVNRLRNEGKKVKAVIGGTTSDDEDIDNANTRSTGINHEGIVNVGTGAKVYGAVVSSAQMAAQVAGMAAGKRLDDSVTYDTVVAIEDVVPRLTHSEIVGAINAGTLVFVHDGNRARVETGINTLTSYAAHQDPTWSKIRVMNTLDAISDDITAAAGQSFIGRVNNDEDGQAALLAAISAYLEVLANRGAIGPEFSVELDPNNPPVGDSVWVLIGCTPLDSMERIYLTVELG